MNLKYIIVLLVIFLQNHLKAQVDDSLRLLIRNAKHDTTRINEMVNLGEFFYSSNPDSAKFYWNEALKIAAKTSKKEKGVIRPVKLYSARAYNNLGAIILREGNTSKAIDYFVKSLKIKEEIKDQKGIGKTANNIGYLLGSQGDSEAAIKYFNISLAARTETQDSSGISQCLNNIGFIHQKDKKYNKALTYYKQSLEIRRRLNLRFETGTTINNIGLIYLEKGQYSVAEPYFRETINIFKESNDEYSLSLVLSNLGRIKEKTGKMDSAYYYANLAFQIADRIKFPDALQTSSDILYNYHKNKGDYKSALRYLEVHEQTTELLRSESTEKDAIKSQLNYEKEKAALAYAKQHEIDQLEIDRKNAEKEADRFKLIFMGVGLVLVVSLLLIIYRSLKNKQRANLLIQEQKAVIEEKSLEINQSIDYAELIQNAVLPKLKSTDLFPESFVLFKPKNVVSGDFFWMEQTTRYKLITACDCTGHGVPGAFISMIGTILLNEIFNSKKLVLPHEILKELDRLIRLTLGQDDESTKLRDGMDIAFCVIDTEKNVLYFAGANNPLWLIKNSENSQLMETKGDKMPIGGATDKLKEFTLHEIPVEKGDTFYIFSDGYADQFGGESGKKLKTANFKKLLLASCTQKMKDQHQFLNTEFDKWKGEHEQLDDVCVIGVKI